MATIQEELQKLPPKQRIERLHQLEKQQSEEEKKRKKDIEEQLKRSIDELAEQEEEEEKLKKEQAEKKESLEEIAGEVKESRQERRNDEQAYQLHQAYATRLAQQPSASLYETARDLAVAQQRGSLSPEDQYRAQNIRGAIQQKKDTGYQSPFISATEKLLEDIKNPFKSKYDH